MDKEVGKWVLGGTSGVLSDDEKQAIKVLAMAFDQGKDSLV